MLKRILWRNHIPPPRFERVALVKIHDKIIFKILLLTPRAVINTAPEYLRDLLRFNKQRSFSPLILVYYVFPQLAKSMLIHSLIDLLCILLQHCVLPLI